jgi:hypothetical protein
VPNGAAPCDPENRLGKGFSFSLLGWRARFRSPSATERGQSPFRTKITG